MNKQFLTEAFKELDLLKEETFSATTDEGEESAKEFYDNFILNDNDEIDVIDPEASTEDELQNSYVGKVILDCSVCHSLSYANPEDINVDETGTLVNVGEECPSCYSTDGFTIVGKVVPYEEETEYDIEIEPKDEVEDEEEIPEEDELEEAYKKGKKKSSSRSAWDKIKSVIGNIDESLETIDLETEHDTIHIQAEEKDDVEGDMIVSPEGMQDFEEIEEEPIPEDEEVDVDLSEFDEDTFNELGEAYLKNTYANVKAFNTTSVKSNGNKLFIEGIIQFKSGSRKITNFIFESNKARKNKVNFVGSNKQITEGKKAFKLSGRVVGKKFISESLNYNYTTKNNIGKSTRVSGTKRVK